MIAAGLPTSAYLDPTWTQVGSKLAQVESMVAPSCLQLALSWTHVGPRSGSPAAPESTQALPNPFHVAFEPPKRLLVFHKIQHRPQKVTQTLNLDLQCVWLRTDKICLMNMHNLYSTTDQSPRIRKSIRDGKDAVHIFTTRMALIASIVFQFLELKWLPYQSLRDRRPIKDGRVAHCSNQCDEHHT